MIKNKKSQIQMMETILILFIFFILLVFGFMFYARFFTGSARTEEREIAQLKAIQIAQRIADLPEIQCTRNNVRVTNCVDLFKLEVAKTIIGSTNQIHYFDLLGYSDITVKQIYPSSADEWNIYKKELDNYQSLSSLFIPTIIYDPTESGQYCHVGKGTCTFGLIEVKVYS